jgi:hypothetical protein
MKTNQKMAMALVLGWARLSAQDAFGYTATDQVAFSYVDIRQTGTSVLSSEDDAFATINLPFGFRFYGNTFTAVCVSVNGALTFGGCPAQDFGNADLTVQSTPGNLASAYPLWSDLSFAGPGGGAIFYRGFGTAGSRQFVIQWSGALPLNTGTPFQFQVILNGNVNQQRLQWSTNSAVLKNNLAIQFTPPPTAGPVDVSASFAVTSSAFTFNRATGRFTGTVTVTNRTMSAISGPLTLLLTGLTAGVTAPTAAGLLPGQGPFYAIPASGPIGPGQSATVAVQFVNPSNARITFVPQVYSGIF